MDSAMHVLFYLFIAVSLIDVAHIGLYLIGANYYDIAKFRKQRGPKPDRWRMQPLVSVLIPAFNEEKAIIRCLDSVCASKYRRLEIIVINDASKDGTAKLVRQFIAEHPVHNVRLVDRKKNAGKGAGLNYALQTLAQGDLIMTLDADSILHPMSIANAVTYFRDPGVVGVAANVRIIDTTTVLGLLQKFEYLVGYRSKKFYSAANCEFIIGGVASTYRADIMRQVGFYDDDIMTEDIGLSLKVVSLGNRAHRIVYGADVIAMTEGVQTFKSLLRQRYRWKMGCLQALFKYRGLLASIDAKYSPLLSWYRIPMAFFGEMLLLAEPLILLFVILLCIELGRPSLLIGAYVTISLYLLVNLWLDEHLSWRAKLKLSYYVPVMYFISYIMNVVQLVAIFRCIANHNLLLGKIKAKSTWISPERSGQGQVTFS